MPGLHRLHKRRLAVKPGRGLALALPLTLTLPLALTLALAGGCGALTQGSVSGRIDPCFGFAPAHWAWPGGTVDVLAGRIRTLPTGPGTGRLEVPSTQVARQTVPPGGSYHFSLSPGRYVIKLEHWGGELATTPVPFEYTSVNVRGGGRYHADLTNACK